MHSEDVPCELSLADKKALLERKLKDHFREEHGWGISRE
jgi:predicted small metal-binding protein